MQMRTARNVIDAYLTALQNRAVSSEEPEDLAHQIADLQARVIVETLPTTKLQLISERRGLERRLDGLVPQASFDLMEKKFIAVAAEWGVARNIEPESWLELGVSEDVLVQAGVFGGQSDYSTTVEPDPPRKARAGERSFAVSIKASLLDRIQRVSRGKRKDVVRDLVERGLRNWRPVDEMQAARLIAATKHDNTIVQIVLPAELWAKYDSLVAQVVPNELLAPSFSASGARVKRAAILIGMMELGHATPEGLLTDVLRS
jgi:hypothetical protein